MADKLPNSNRVVFDLTFVQDAFDELPFYMQQKENFVKLQNVISGRFNKCQTEAIKMAYLRFLDNAEGVVLDSIASRLFIERSGQDDDSLKGAIKLRALSQDSEGTRGQIVNLLKVISGGDYVKVFKGPKNYVEVVFPSECLNTSEVKVSLSDLFPINTNLIIGDSITGLNVFGVGSVHDPSGTTSKISPLGSIHDALSEREQTTSVMIISDERDL